MVKHPVAFVRQPSFQWILLVYSGTYTIANTSESLYIRYAKRKFDELFLITIVRLSSSSSSIVPRFPSSLRRVRQTLVYRLRRIERLRACSAPLARRWSLCRWRRSDCSVCATRSRSAHRSRSCRTWRRWSRAALAGRVPMPTLRVSSSRLVSRRSSTRHSIYWVFRKMRETVDNG